jgi:hypothetical protein
MGSNSNFEKHADRRFHVVVTSLIFLLEIFRFQFSQKVFHPFALSFFFVVEGLMAFFSVAIGKERHAHLPIQINSRTARGWR